MRAVERCLPAELGKAINSPSSIDWLHRDQDAKVGCNAGLSLSGLPPLLELCADPIYAGYLRLSATGHCLPYRFYMLYDKIWREDILAHAYELARANKGAPGVDGQSFEQIESAGLEEWIETSEAF
jgi:hypothetical protein